MRSLLPLLLVAGAVVSADKLIKSYDFSSRNAVANQWNIIVWPAGHVNNELQNYTNSQDTMYTSSGGVLNIRTKAAGSGYVSARLESKDTFSCLQFGSLKYRVQFEASVPAYEGAWPALWMLGVPSTYGDWPKTGEIDQMEWVWQIKSHVQSSLHWKGANDFGQADTDFPNGMTDIRKVHTYRADVSCMAGSSYIQFSVDNHYYPKIPSATWSGSYTPDKPCSSGVRSDRTSRCTDAMPFDNAFQLIVNTAVGGAWGGVDVNDYSAMDGDGVLMQVHSIQVYELS